MTETYAKLFNTILASTIWQEPDATRLVWVTMLALADARGEVQASVPGLAHLARVDLSACEQALHSLLSPDPYSRTTAYEGRRIEAIRGGWKLLNHELYRNKLSTQDRREQNRISQQKCRERKRLNDVSSGHQLSAMSEHTDTNTDTAPDAKGDTEAKTYTPKPEERSLCSGVQSAKGRTAQVIHDPPGFRSFWKAYPRHQKHSDALKLWEKLGCEAVADRIVAHVELMKAKDDAWRRGYSPLPTTYLEGHRWSDEPQDPPKSRLALAVEEFRAHGLPRRRTVP